jgi:hypothetical protein
MPVALRLAPQEELQQQQQQQQQQQVRTCTFMDDCLYLAQISMAISFCKSQICKYARDGQCQQITSVMVEGHQLQASHFWLSTPVFISHESLVPLVQAV